MTNCGSDEPENYTFGVKYITCFTPNQVHSSQVHIPDLIINYLHLQWIKQQQINTFCVILFHYAQNVVFSAL